jgi:hypothetical protein
VPTRQRVHHSVLVTDTLGPCLTSTSHLARRPLSQSKRGLLHFLLPPVLSLSLPLPSRILSQPSLLQVSNQAFVLPTHACYRHGILPRQPRCRGFVAQRPAGSPAICSSLGVIHAQGYNVTPCYSPIIHILATVDRLIIPHFYLSSNPVTVTIYV